VSIRSRSPRMEIDVNGMVVAACGLSSDRSGLHTPGTGMPAITANPGNLNNAFSVESVGMTSVRDGGCSMAVGD